MYVVLSLNGSTNRHTLKNVTRVLRSFRFYSDWVKINLVPNEVELPVTERQSHLT